MQSWRRLKMGVFRAPAQGLWSKLLLAVVVAVVNNGAYRFWKAFLAEMWSENLLIWRVVRGENGHACMYSGVPVLLTWNCHNMLTGCESESRSVVSDSLRPQGLYSPMGFSRPEHWSGEPFPSPLDLPNSGIKPRSPALQADALPAEPQGKPYKTKSFFK